METQRSKKTAGIVTYTHKTNYGCVLQRYALQTTLERLGFDVETLIFHPSHRDERTLLQRFDRSFSEIVSLVFRRLANMPGQILFDRNLEKKQKKQRAEIFAKFENRFLKSSTRFDSYAEVQEQGDDYDVLIAGSDQIWNSEWLYDEIFYKFYMLDFAPGRKKLSYAASLGLSQLPEEVVPKFQRYLFDFSWISVREKEGAGELERILNRPIDLVLDPTMLLSLEDWDALVEQFPADKIQEGSCILCYSLSNQKDVVGKALQIRKYHKLPVVYICTTIREYVSIKLKHSCVTPILKAGPGEFVSLFKNSAYVVTDSFHGSVFSILYHKPFFTMMRDKADPTKSMNSRMTTLFSTFHLESRLFSPEDKSPLTPEKFEIDYEDVDKILQERREFSINKLREATENVVTNTAKA